jgi:7-cyano-7-deazaguanine synthase
MAEPMPNSAALVLFSGGQDSTVCLAWALERFERVETVGFDYGQRHAIELEQRHVILRALKERFARWAEKLGEDHIIEMAELGAISETALTREAEIEMTAAGLPSTFVPGRNLLFFTYAAALGYRRSIHALVGGMCETDYSGYPDCRDETIRALEKSISLGMDRAFTLLTPLMWIGKADTWAMADALGGETLVEIIVEQTHTCYLGERSARHDWGYGCGICPACALRARGWQQWRRDAAVVRAE